MVTKQTRAGRRRKPETAEYREVPPKKGASAETLRKAVEKVKANRKFDVMEILERD